MSDQITYPPRLVDEGETEKAYQAFRTYCLLGDDRSLDKVREKLGKRTVRHIEGWSSKYNWQERIAAFDELVGQVALDKWVERREELREQDWEQGAKLRTRVEDLLDAMPKFIQQTRTVDEETGREIVTIRLNAPLGQVASALKAGSELQRLAAGEPTERIDTQHSGFVGFSGSFVDGLSELSDEELDERIDRLASIHQRLAAASQAGNGDPADGEVAKKRSQDAPADTNSENQ